MLSEFARDHLEMIVKMSNDLMEQGDIKGACIINFIIELHLQSFKKYGGSRYWLEIGNLQPPLILGDVPKGHTGKTGPLLSNI